MKIIAMLNQKGGVAKTTTTWCMGVALSKLKGYKVLICDLDAQCNVSFNARVDLMNLKVSLYDVFKGDANINDAIIPVDDNLDIVTGSINLASADRDFNKLGREKMLQKAFKQLNNEYDYILLDCPPSLNVMCENALTVADSVIIPMGVDMYALQGISQLQGFIDDIRENSNPNLAIDGILITRVNEQTNLYKTLKPQIEKVADGMGCKVFNTPIRENVAVGESIVLRGNIFELSPKANASVDYKAFIDEFLTR